MEEKGVPKTFSMDLATPTPSNNTNGGRGYEINAIEGEEEIIWNEPQALEDEVAERERFATKN